MRLQLRLHCKLLHIQVRMLGAKLPTTRSPRDHTKNKAILVYSFESLQLADVSEKGKGAVNHIVSPGKKQASPKDKQFTTHLQRTG